VGSLLGCDLEIAGLDINAAWTQQRNSKRMEFSLQNSKIAINLQASLD
jgi:hypothetical protein